MAEVIQKVSSKKVALSLKKETAIKFAIGLLVAVIMLPVLDWLIQTSITSQYVAFYKSSDVSRAAYVKELERQYGDQVVNEMLAKAAIAQAAKERGITISNEEVDAAIERDKQSAGITSDDEFTSVLAQNGISESDYRAYVKVTVTLDRLLEGTVAEPTEKEIEEYYADNKEYFADQKLEDVKEQIATDIKQSNLNTLRQDWLSKALAGYNKENTLVTQDSRQYGFMKSITLLQRLFSNDPTK